MQGFATRLSLLKLPRSAPLLPEQDYVIGDLPYVPNFPHPMNLGTPAEALRSRIIFAGNLVRNGLIVVALVGVGVLVGNTANTEAPAPTLKQRVDTLQRLTPRQAVMLLPSEKRKCAFDWHEACVACTHVSDLGEIIKTSMC